MSVLTEGAVNRLTAAVLTGVATYHWINDQGEFVDNAGQLRFRRDRTYAEVAAVVDRRYRSMLEETVMDSGEE